MSDLDGEMDYSETTSKRPAPPKNGPYTLPPVVNAPDPDGRYSDLPTAPPQSAGTCIH